MNVERLTAASRLGRHVARTNEAAREAERMNGPARRERLRGAARQLMQAGLHDLARDMRRRARGGAN
jgi:hypothetical protein